VEKTIKELFVENGYVRIKQFFDESDLALIESNLNNFHQRWKKGNSSFYANNAINSAYITGRQYLDDDERNGLFQFIGLSKLLSCAKSIMRANPAFMNTQLFFNPANLDQKNYWHRDPQYHLSLDEQKAALNGVEVLHFRVPLYPEPGIELIPGSHANWDTDEELDVRLERNGKKNHFPLSSGVEVPLQRGDLFIFSGNMIHRGIYGLDRLSFDILFCDPDPELLQFSKKECLPDTETLSNLENPEAFVRTIQLKSKIES
jgi:ectoine hydroxylase-related dioxygenase (phytanoyl-CoA dioxygenase family)